MKRSENVSYLLLITGNFNAAHNPAWGREMQYSSNSRVNMVGFALLFAATLLTACGGQKARMQEIDGVLHVMNPVDPMNPGMVIDIQEDFRIGQDEGEDEYIFPGITGLTVDANGRAFVLVAQDDAIRVFKPDGSYSHAIGRQGQGPGELFAAQTINRGPEGNIWVASMGTQKITIFEPEGTYLRDITFPRLPPVFVQTTADGFMGLYVNPVPTDDPMLMSITYSLRRFTAEGDSLNNLFENTVQMDLTDLQLGGLQDQIPFYTQDDQGRVWQTRARTDIFEVNVYNPEGSLDRVVEKEHVKIEKSEEEIQDEKDMVERAMAAQMGQVPDEVNLSYEPERYRVATGFPHYDPRGYVWVQTSREGTMDTNDFLLFDMRGQYVQKVMIPDVMSPLFLTFVGDKLYLVDQNPDVSPQVIVYTVTISN